MEKPIDSHYTLQAHEHRFSWASTMMERDIREIEIESLSRIISKLLINRSNPQPLKILEIGCGNGYVAARLTCEFPNIKIEAFDSNFELIELAKSRKLHNTIFSVGNFEDVGSLDFLEKDYDFIFSVRCLINIESAERRENALEKISGYLKSGGYLALLEGFESGQSKYNELRTAFSFEKIPPAWHNNYLDIERTKSRLNSTLHYLDNDMCLNRFDVEIHHLSTHYLAMRVLLPAIKMDGDFYRENRNNRMGQALSRILPATQDFSPLQLHIWEK
jgi:SAM-dependent methyltransferase